MGSPSGGVGSSASSAGSGSAGGSSGSGLSGSSSSGSSSSSATSSGGSDFGGSVSQAGNTSGSGSSGSSSSSNDNSGSDNDRSDGDRSTSSGPSADPGLTSAQSAALAESAAVMDGYAMSPTAAVGPSEEESEPAEEKGFFERAGEAIVDTGELLGGVAVGAGETAWDGVVGAADLAWEGVSMVNDAAGTVLDTAVGWTGIDAFDGHARRNAERGQAMVDFATSLPDVPGQIASSAAQGWETFEDNWETGNYYDAGRQIGGVGLEAATIAVPAAKAGALGRLGRVDDVAPAASVARGAGAELDDVLREIREAGAEIVTDADPDVKAYLDDAARREGIAPEDMHASTLGDTIVVRDHLKDDVVTLREELEHVRQQQDGRVSVGAGGHDTRVDLEIEARERLLERDDLNPAEREQLQREIDTIRERGRY